MRLLRRLRVYTSGLAAVLMTAVPAAAQTVLPDRVFVDVNAGVQEGPTRLAVVTPLPAFGREGTLTVDDTIIGGGLFDVSGSLKVRGDFAVGAGYSRTSSTGSYPYTAVVPSPIGINTGWSNPDIVRPDGHEVQGIIRRVSCGG